MTQKDAKEPFDWELCLLSFKLWNRCRLHVKFVSNVNFLIIGPIFNTILEFLGSRQHGKCIIYIYFCLNLRRVRRVQSLMMLTLNTREKFLFISSKNHLIEFFNRGTMNRLKDFSRNFSIKTCVFNYENY